VATLISHLRHRLTGHFGSDRIDVWRAKEELHKHPVDDVADLIVAKLALLLNKLPAGTIDRLRAESKLDTPVVFPWGVQFAGIPIRRQDEDSPCPPSLRDHRSTTR